MSLTEVKPGLRFRGLVNRDKLGTVLYIDYLDDLSVYYRWDGESQPGCWYGVDCECEVVETAEGTPLIDSTKLNKEDRYLQRNTEEALLGYFERSKQKLGNKLYNVKTPSDYQEKLDTIVHALAM